MSDFSSMTDPDVSTEDSMSQGLPLIFTYVDLGQFQITLFK